MCSHFRAILIAALLFEAVHTKEMLMFAGAAGCDAADDAKCARDTPEAEHVMWEYVLNTDTGTVRQLGQIQVPGVPAWLLSAPQLPHCLFATLVTTDELASFEISGTKIIPRGRALAGGINPVHASVTSDGRLLLAANYHGPDDVNNSHGASVASFSIANDCSLALASVVPHSGASVVHPRQDSAHPHSFVAASHGKLAYACDLGQDIVVTYSVGADGSLQELDRAHAAPGDGPRHLVLHPTAPFAYVVNELANSVRVYQVASDGTLLPLESFSTLPLEVTFPDSKAAELAISSDGATLYASNRGRHNCVCVFAVTDSGRRLQQVQQVRVSQFPRGMVLAPGGSLLVVAGQHLGVVDTFKVSAAKNLIWTGNSITGPPTVATLAVVDASIENVA